jgi:hypothetical protein
MASVHDAHRARPTGRTAPTSKTLESSVRWSGLATSDETAGSRPTGKRFECWVGRLLRYESDSAGPLADRRESDDRQAARGRTIGAGVVPAFMPKQNSAPVATPAGRSTTPRVPRLATSRSIARWFAQPPFSRRHGHRVRPVVVPDRAASGSLAEGAVWGDAAEVCRDRPAPALASAEASLCCRSLDRFQRAFHIVAASGPVRDRDAHRGHAVPGRTTQPTGAISLDGLDIARRCALAHQCCGAGPTSPRFSRGRYLSRARSRRRAGRPRGR